MAARGWRGGTAAVAGLERAVGNCNRGEEKSRVFQVATVSIPCDAFSSSQGGEGITTSLIWNSREVSNRRGIDRSVVCLVFESFRKSRLLQVY